MQLTITLNAGQFRVNLERSHNCAIPLSFEGRQVNHFAADAASASPMQSGSFVGDVGSGGSCNAKVLTLNPHCNGTHTESISHIVKELKPPVSCIDSGLIPATLISVQARAAKESRDSYRPQFEAADYIIDEACLRQHLDKIPDEMLQALLIRTLPNDASKLTRHYNNDNQPAFFSIEAIDYLVKRKVQHLLVDFPSVDRLYDDGLLTIHHRFWQVPEKTHTLHTDSRTSATITEMIFLPSEINDGLFLLSLGLLNFVTDAVPSAPIIYPLEPL